MRFSDAFEHDDTSGYILSAAAQTDAAGLWRLHCARMAQRGFDRLLYGATPVLDAATGAANGVWTVLSSHSAAYTARYVENAARVSTDAMRWALEGPAVREWQREAPRDAEPSSPNEINPAQDVCAGCTIRFGTEGRRWRGAIALSATPDLDQEGVAKLLARDGKMIRAENEYFHLKLTSLPCEFYRLTARQCEVLELVACGHTTQEVARMLCLTPTTVEKHLRLAREVLAASNTTHAVFKAALHNSIFSQDSI